MKNELNAKNIKDAKEPKGLRKNLLGLIAWLVVTYAFAAFGSFFEPGSWYDELVKPAWTPPSWVFGPVWTLLYTAMAVAAWLVWRQGGWQSNRLVLALYIIQLLLNAVWSWLFFGQQWIGLALIDIILLFILIFSTMILFWRRNRPAGILFLPYLIWVAFASTLNFAFWRLN